MLSENMEYRVRAAAAVLHDIEVYTDAGPQFDPWRIYVTGKYYLQDDGLRFHTETIHGAANPTPELDYVPDEDTSEGRRYYSIMASVRSRMEEIEHLIAAVKRGDL